MFEEEVVTNDYCNGMIFTVAKISLPANFISRLKSLEGFKNKKIMSMASSCIRRQQNNRASCPERRGRELENQRAATQDVPCRCLSSTHRV